MTEEAFIQAIVADPDDDGVRLVYADGLAAIGDTKGSIANLEQLLRAEPDNVAALNNLSWLYHQAGDARAAAVAKRAYELQPKRPEVADTYGWILLSEGKVPEALRTLGEAAALAPRQPDIAYHHAAALAQGGERPEAQRRLRTLLVDYQDFSERKAAQDLLAQLDR